LRIDNVRLAAFAAAALMVIGGLGAWIVAAASGDVLANGSDRDGLVIIVCAVVYAVCVLTGRRGLLIVATLAAVVGAATSITDLADVESEPLLDAGWGLWLDAVASLSAFVLAAALRRRPRTRGV
jgi:hypothetical protein